VLKKISFAIASVGYIGFFPVASGTVASLATLPAVWLLDFAGGIPLLLAVLVLSIITGLIFTEIALKYSEDSDPSYVVIDEFAGQLLTLLPPLLFFKGSFPFWWIYLAGFVLFRFFDIIKPWHVGWVDKNVRGAFGVMLDDIIAGVYAAIILTAGLFAAEIILKYY
jgi:phosphatidylglycerophosphatase A